MYCTYNDILQLRSKYELLDLINDENIPYNEISLSDLNNPCRKRIEEAITAADAEIDGYLRQRYTLPLTEVPLLIKYTSCSLALEALFMRRLPEDMPATVLNDAKAKRNMLKNIAEGLIGIGIEEKSTNNASEKFTTNKSSADRQFTPDELKKY